MEVVISSAISIDGYIADTKGGTEWVLDWDLFEKACKEYGCICMGRSTYEEGGSEFDGAQHLILSSESGQNKENVHFVNSVEQAISKAQELGFSKLLVIGGAKTNESFIKSGKVSKLLIDEHPLILGNGKRLFGDFSQPLKLKLLGTKQHPQGFVHLEYELI